MRLALEKQQRLDKNVGPLEAITKFFNNYADRYFAKFDSHSWRAEEFWTEAVETVLLKYNTELRAIYDSYAGLSRRRGGKGALACNYFVQMLTEA